MKADKIDKLFSPFGIDPKYGHKPLEGNFPPEDEMRQTEIEEVTITLGAPLKDWGEETLPEDGLYIPSAEPRKIFGRNIPAGLGKQGFMRACAAAAYALFKGPNVLNIFASGGEATPNGEKSSHMMRRILSEIFPDSPSLSETESWDTTTNLVFVLDKLREQFPVLYNRISTGVVPITIITSGANIDRRFTPFDQSPDQKPSLKQKVLEYLGGLSIYGTHSFRVAQMIDEANKRGFKIRSLPAEVILADLSDKYGITDEISKRYSIGRFRKDESFFSFFMAYAPQIVSGLLMRLAQKRLKERGSQG